MRTAVLYIAFLTLAAPVSMTGAGSPGAGGTLSGFVRDGANGESIPFASVYIRDLKLGTTTNAEGYYAIPNIPDGDREVRVSIVGYRPSTFTIRVGQGADIVRNVLLVSESVQVDEVVVTADPEEVKRATQTSHIVLQAADVVSLPAVGEPDVFRALQLMPGVKATSEISSALNVRGEAPIRTSFCSTARWCTTLPTCSVFSAPSIMTR